MASRIASVSVSAVGVPGLALAAALTLGLGGCAPAVQAPNAQMARAQWLVAESKEHAAGDKEAQAHIRAAQDDLLYARALMLWSDWRLATSAIARACAEARLALAIVERRSAEADAREAARRLAAAQQNLDLERE